MHIYIYIKISFDSFEGSLKAEALLSTRKITETLKYNKNFSMNRVYQFFITFSIYF